MAETEKVWNGVEILTVLVLRWNGWLAGSSCGLAANSVVLKPEAV